MLYDFASVLKKMASRITDKLYLSKNPDVFVDLNDVAQHQVDGVRYLYKQFKKKKPGVILNDPQGYGKRKQITLFLNAIHNLVENPILVLCNEDNLGKWQRRFSTFLNDSSQIITPTENINPFAKCQVFMTPAENASLCARRQWSVIVIDYEDNKSILKTKLDGFKIWITSVDMKEHLELFSPIYQWFYPKDKILISDYVAETKIASEVVRNALLLDALMAGIVLRRNGIAGECIEGENINNNKELKPVSKRVKRRHDADVIIAKDNTEITKKKTSPNYCVKVRKLEDFMDVETFIRTHKPITSDNIEMFHFIQATQKQVEKTISKKNKEISNSEKEHKTSTNIKKNESVVKLFEDLSEDTVNHANNDFKMATDSDVVDFDCTDIDLKDNISKENITISDSEINCEYQNEIKIRTEDEASEIELEDDENKDDIKLTIKTEDVATNELELEIHENMVGFTTNNVFEEPVETNSELNSTVKDRPQTDLERQILELEQETMKQFKGSFLDSIF